MAGPEWRLSEGPIDYPTAIEEMELRVAAVRAGTLGEQVWLLEHPPLYTAGTSAKPSDLLGPSPFPVYKTGRGGQFTYHGPGQRVAYVMLDLKRRRPDVRCFVQGLEEWMILTLERFGVKAGRRDGRIGIWVPRNGSREDKIAAIGVRVRRWVTYHGVALNVAPDLNHFKGIVPCGIAEANFGVTSLHALGVPVKMAEVDAVLRETFGAVFEAEGAAMICQNPD
ncbi:MAG TPA: lipoyl(octanoyl) transferase LipB [Alphaproteobacteria bacterium]|nr:lipoyl(octanoyl) transferase LipB [Alphaproteobacteria bacterium]